MTRAALPAALALVLAGTLAFAQQTPPAAPDTQVPAPAQAPARTPNPHKQTLRLAKELNLSPDQTAKVEPILAERDRKIAALRANTSVEPFIAKAQMRAIQKSTQDQLSTVLTSDQLEQLKSLQHAHAPKAQPQPLTVPAA